MVEKAPFCFLKPQKLTEAEAQQKLSISIDGYPKELFKYIDFEDIHKEKYFITSYGRVFTNYGRELFPDQYLSKNNNIYMRIELACSTYIKQRKFFVHRLVANAFIPKTDDDIVFERNVVNHKYNKDGRCNYVWNLEWTNISENTLHGLYFSDYYDESLFDFSYIVNRRNLVPYDLNDLNGERNPKARISEYQVRLICYAYTILHYSPRDCAIYAWMDGSHKDVLLVNSIINGYCWKHISAEYGIKPKDNNHREHNPYRPEMKKIYDDMKNKK